MSRENRRRFAREFKKLPKGDHCGICGKEFPHNSRTFGGLMADGSMMLAGECCSSRLAEIMVAGLYMTRGVDLLTNPAKSRPQSNEPRPQNADQAVLRIQSFVSQLDASTNVLARQAGVPENLNLKGVFLDEYPWKTNDANWFKEHPERSHRLRPMLEGEAEAMPFHAPAQPIPPNHRIEVLVRQIEPGKRIRKTFGRNVEMEIPDDEEIIHAIFDNLVENDGSSIIDLRAILERARQYKNNRGQHLS